MTNRFNLVKREIIYESDIILTPLLDRFTIDIDAVVEFCKKEYEKAGLKPEDCDVEVALTKVYPNAHKHFSPAGLDMERVKFSPAESETRVLSCSQLDAWKEVWDKPWIMCEIFATCQDEGFMEGVNPKLKWHKHVERDGAKGLAHGPEYPCTIGLKLVE